jgi:hypothetical protein
MKECEAGVESAWLFSTTTCTGIDNWEPVMALDAIDDLGARVC